MRFRGRQLRLLKDPEIAFYILLALYVVSAGFIEPHLPPWANISLGLAMAAGLIYFLGRALVFNVKDVGVRLGRRIRPPKA